MRNRAAELAQMIQHAARPDSQATFGLELAQITAELIARAEIEQFPLLDAEAYPDLVNRFSYHPADSTTASVYADIRSKHLQLAAYLSGVAPKSRELSLAYTHLEESMFWANAAIARQTPIATDPERARQ